MHNPQHHVERPEPHEPAAHRGDHRSKGWIAFAVINALITFFGSSYIWFPGEAVVAAGYRTEGVAHVPSAWWGAFVLASAAAMLVVALVGLRPNRAWARRAALYEFPFLFLVVVIEPDPVFPTFFALILGFALWRLHRAARPAAARGVGPSEAMAG